MHLILEETKAEELEAVLKKAGTSIKDFEIKVPSWYRRESYRAATVDLADMVGKPCTVHLKDATMSDDDRIMAHAMRENAPIDSTFLGLCFRAHVERIEGEGADVFDGAPPGNSDKWDLWVKKSSAKLVGRIWEGVKLFRKDAGVTEGN